MQVYCDAFCTCNVLFSDVRLYTVNVLYSDVYIYVLVVSEVDSTGAAVMAALEGGSTDPS